jgi:hypothetical protein
MKKIFVLLIILTVCSCKNSSDSEDDFAVEDSSEISSDTIPIQTVRNFEISKLSDSKFYTHEEHDNWTIYTMKFTLTNNTNYKITKFFIEDSISINFKNDDGGRYYDGVLFSAKPKINVKNPWLPKENREFEIYIPDTFGMVAHLSPTNFERTPENVTLNLKYNWFSIDEEGNEQDSFDLIKEWKDYQKSLGYR